MRLQNIGVLVCSTFLVLAPALQAQEDITKTGPLSRKVTDEQVALYLEEHEPTLDSTILSAMEATERPGDWSPELIRKLGIRKSRRRQ